MLILEIAAGVALAPVLWWIVAGVVGVVCRAIERSSYTSL
jgi:hypothetical protein